MSRTVLAVYAKFCCGKCSRIVQFVILLMYYGWYMITIKLLVQKSNILNGDAALSYNVKQLLEVLGISRMTMSCERNVNYGIVMW
jgi:hypothetical protein